MTSPPLSPPPPAGAARASGRFEGRDEDVYHARKFEELRRYALRTMLTLPPLIMGLWLWDWVIDAQAAPGTLGLRIGMAACLLPCILALRSEKVGALGFTFILYAGVLGTEVFWLAILRRLEGGLVYHIDGYMYYVLGLLVIGLPLRFWDNVVGLSLALIVPDVAAMAGLLPGFSYAKYNTLILPAGALSLYAMWAFDRLYRRLFSYQRDVERLAGEDPLTGIANRRQFMASGAQMFDRAKRYKRPASLLVMDLDHFKTINDKYGHAAGDAVLQAAASLLSAHRRGPDVPARLGGEEFAILLPETELPGAVAFAESLRTALEAMRIPIPDTDQELAITMSVGVAQYLPTDESLDLLLHRGDAALYRAKKNGRNQVAH